MQDGVSSYHRYMQGVKGALEELVALYSDALVRYACCLLSDPSAAEDCAEDAFVALIVRHRKIKDEEHLRAYLFKTVRSKCIDRLRAAGKTAPMEESLLPCGEAESVLFARERDRILYAAMQELPADYRSALFLVYLEGFTPEECAAILKKNKKQLYNLLARGKAALKRKLVSEGFSYEDLS